MGKMNKQTEHPMKELGSFIVDENNKYPRAVAAAVIADPGDKFNPLYIYGDAGSGKTHLLQSVVTGLKERNPEKNIEYVEAESFNRNSYDDKIDLMCTWPFVDALIIDDVHLMDFEDLQDLLQTAVVALSGLNKQVVLSGNCPMPQLNLDTRIVRHFYAKFGYTIGIPNIIDKTTKVRILEQLARDSDLEVNDEIESVIDYIAEESDGNIKKMKNLFNYIIGVSRLQDCQINIAIVIELLRSIGEV